MTKAPTLDFAGAEVDKPERVTCPECNGHGCDESGEEFCPECGGLREVRKSRMQTENNDLQEAVLSCRTPDDLKAMQLTILAIRALPT